MGNQLVPKHIYICVSANQRRVYDNAEYILDDAYGSEFFFRHPGESPECGFIHLNPLFWYFIDITEVGQC